MATSTMKPKRGTTAQWARSERILEWNEWGVEETVRGEWILRVGDGEHEFLDLPKVIDTPSLNDLVAEARNTYNLFFDKAEEMEDRFEELSAEITSKHETAISDIETKGAETLATIPEDYTETYNRAVKNSRDIEFVKSTATRNDKRLTNVEKELFKEPFVIDSSVAYTKDVPEDALPYAEVTEIGGMTRKCTNLLPISDGSYSVNGCTITVNNGLVTVTGTATVSGGRTSPFARITLSIGTYIFNSDDDVYLSKATDKSIVVHGKGKAFTLTEETSLMIGYNFETEQTYSESFHVWINKGDTALPYEPYFEGLRSAPVTEVKSVGENLISYPYLNTTKTVNGITFIDNGDGSISIKGTSTAQADFLLFRKNLGDTNIDAVLLDGSTNGKFALNKRLYYSATNKTVTIVVQRGTTIDETIYPMANKGSTVQPYTPYFEHTLPIPAEVQALDGYGWGMSDTIYNYIDWEKMQFVKRVAHVSDLGSLNWISGDVNLSYAVLPEECAKSFASLNIGVEGISFQHNRELNAVVVHHSYGRDQTAVSAALSGVEYLYSIEPVITDISDILPDDNYIGVEGGGTGTMVNEYGYDVPSEVVYRLKEGESA